MVVARVDHALEAHPEWQGRIADTPETDFCGLPLDGVDCFSQSLQAVSCNFALPQLRDAITHAASSTHGWTQEPRDAKGGDDGGLVLTRGDTPIVAHLHDLPDFGMSMVQADSC